VTATGLRRAAHRYRGELLAIAGVLAFEAVLVWYIRLAQKPDWWMFPIDMQVYQDGGEIVRHAPQNYHPQMASPLYDWSGPAGFFGLRFTYPPFAAMLFAPLSYLRLKILAEAAAIADVLALPTITWIAVGAFGYRRGPARLGLAMLAAAAVFFTEPVQRTIFLGQIDLLLMLLVLWDLCQPERRWWQGVGVGLAAGIKLVPLLFIPYLLLTRRFRQAAVATATFGLTIAAGFAVLPADASAYWLDGLLFHGNRDGNIYWAGNQSLLGILSRLGRGANVHDHWLVAAAVTGAVGLACAAVLDRAGHRMLGLCACALTALLVSPISWDHHWVWIVLIVPVAVCYAIRLRRAARWACVGLAAAVTAIFFAWPTTMWGEHWDPNGWTRGIIWAPPNANYAEYRWHGLQQIVGNAYVLTGLALFVLLVVVTVVTLRSRRARPVGGTTPAPTVLTRA
jgi:alpha-1,2-mannosyltransferase